MTGGDEGIVQSSAPWRELPAALVNAGMYHGPWASAAIGKSKSSQQMIERDWLPGLLYPVSRIQRKHELMHPSTQPKA